MPCRFLNRLTHASLVFFSLFLAGAASANATLSLDPSAIYLLNTAKPPGSTFKIYTLAASANATLSLDPSAIYLLNTANPPGSTFKIYTLGFSLFDMGFTAGDTLFMYRFGDYKPGTGIGPITGLPTDIFEDFDVNNGSAGTAVTIPVGAQYVFFTEDDTNFANNTDPNENFGVNISTVSEPSSLAAMLLGLSAMGFVARRRKTR